MPLETWSTQPNAYDVIQKGIFFSDLKSNLTAVTRDYMGLGVEDEAVMIEDINRMFSGDIVPARADWDILDDILHRLMQVKEFSERFHDFFGDVELTLGVSDLVNIRDFLDAIQRIGPKPPSLSLQLPKPGTTQLTVPIATSTNQFRDSINLTWNVNADASPYAKLTVLPSPSEDVSSYAVHLTAGTFKKSFQYGPVDTMTPEFQLNWASWFSLSNLKNASINCRVDTTDKRDNVTTIEEQFKYTSEVRMQTPIASYVLEYNIDNGNWIAMGTSLVKSFLWTSVPNVTGTYRFRVRGIDQLNQLTDWQISAPQYIDFLDPPGKPAPTATGYEDTLTLKWAPVPRAERYVAWVGNEAEAKAATKGSTVRWIQVPSSTALNEGKFLTYFKPVTRNIMHTLHVRAENRVGTNTGTTTAKTIIPIPKDPDPPVAPPVKVLKKITYTPVHHEVWNGTYYFRMNGTTSPPGWRSDQWKETIKNIYNGGWEEINLGTNWRGIYYGTQIHWRSNGAYAAYNYQNWGNNMSFIYYDYLKIQRDLAGKEIKDVTIQLARTGSIHGHASGSPVYLYNSNRENSKSTSTANAFTLFRPDNGTAVSFTNQSAAYVYKIGRSATAQLNTLWSKQLVQRIVNGQAKGLGMVKYYGNTFNAKPSNGDPAYMIFDPKKMTITVNYYD